MSCADDYVDDITNGLMDLIREKTGLDSDSDEDDEIYSAIHRVISDLDNGREGYLNC